ncbi:MAG: hypothetical protein J0I84_15725 [Terrimonas sp.]|nr:hypothetical protein [Terrimonas sp.]OJY92183.1 MAG: hypothetical protein BGP13_08445 [Sphingobacteriales bacterium 40-81]
MQGIARTRLKQKLNPGEAKPFTTHRKRSNRRSVWEITIKPFKDKHFAVFPLELPTLCIKAGSRTDDIVLDPFMGAGTTALAAALLQRKCIGFELNPDYAAIARRRLRRSLGLFYPSTD